MGVGGHSPQVANPGQRAKLARQFYRKGNWGMQEVQLNFGSFTRKGGDWGTVDLSMGWVGKTWDGRELCEKKA